MKMFRLTGQGQSIGIVAMLRSGESCVRSTVSGGCILPASLTTIRLQFIYPCSSVVRALVCQPNGQGSNPGGLVQSQLLQLKPI